MVHFIFSLKANYLLPNRPENNEETILNTVLETLELLGADLDGFKGGNTKFNKTNGLGDPESPAVLDVVDGVEGRHGNVGLI